QSGIVWELDEALASQCGYTITYSSRNSLVFRASALSCHSHLDKDVFTVTIQINVAHTPDMKNATAHQKSASCSYGPQSPREIVCETSYMEVRIGSVSVRRDVPQNEKDFILNEPQDWILSFSESLFKLLMNFSGQAKAMEASVWQIVFHRPEEKRALLVSDAWRAGFGFSTTENRILLRVPYNAAQVQLVKNHTEGVLIIKFQTFVSSGKHGTKYYISLFLEHQWEDSKWGLTKYTVIKEIETPFEHAGLAVTNNPNLSTRLMNVTVGMFLLDVELVNLTIEGTTVTVSEAIQHGYLTYEIQYANGSKVYVIQVPFDAPGIKKEYTSDDTREYTLNVTLKFIIVPTSDTFAVPIVTVTAVKDAVLPSARGFCDENYFYLIITHGNVDQNWLPFISDQHLMPEAAQKYYYSLSDNGTHLAISVPFLSSLVDYKDIHISGVIASLHLILKDGITLANRKDFSISCRFRPSELIQCLPNGTVVITAIKLVRLADLDTSLLVLRDRRCKPSLVTKKTATFKFNVNTCGTSRKCSLLEKSYSEPYQELEYPVVKYLREALYFEVELLHPADPRLELNLENCWATNSRSQDSLPQWPILINGYGDHPSCEWCENNEDSYRTVFHKVNYSLRVKFPQHLKRFEVTMFTFVQGTTLSQMQLYFHCSIVVCSTTPLSSDMTCQRRCNPQKQLGKKNGITQAVPGACSAAHNALLGVLSIGRLLLVCLYRILKAEMSH
ncbi:hypothetical protein ASZ78_015931, partial [Callipepla squamata]